ncbi:MAG TPA: YciI family protein [Polyangiaceae bacterium]
MSNDYLMILANSADYCRIGAPTMKYLCLLYGNQKKVSSLSKEQFATLVEKCQVYDAELQRTGAVRSVESLDWDVTTVRPQNGKPTVVDGPFVETRDVVGSFMVIEARDLNDAIRIASLHPAANMGEDLGWGIEIRPIAEGCHQ